MLPKEKLKLTSGQAIEKGFSTLTVYLNMELLKNIDAWVPEYRSHSLSSGKRGEREVPMPALSLIPAGTVTKKNILLPLAIVTWPFQVLCSLGAQLYFFKKVHCFAKVMLL